MDKIGKQLQNIGRLLVDRELTFGNAGNISGKINDDCFIITASGTKLGDLADDDVVTCTFDNQVLSEEKRPSKEVPMHLAVYEERPDINAVIHASPFYTTMVACTNLAIPSNLFVESMYYLEKIERIPYYHPGSAELGEAVRKVAGRANILLLENHGVLAYDKTLEEALTAIQTLEFMCKMIVLGKNLDGEWNYIDSKTEQDFLENAGYKPRRRWEF